MIALHVSVTHILCTIHLFIYIYIDLPIHYM